MQWIPTGTFRMGSDADHPEERPARDVSVQGFWMDDHPVTVAEYRSFVAATGYATAAERRQDQPGSFVFRPAKRPIPLEDSSAWWKFLPGASWRSPLGPASSTVAFELDPVVHITHEDALAYCRWAGKDLPTEAEWEMAARGGLPAKSYAWGDELAPHGRVPANIWQGQFPWDHDESSRYTWTSRVRAFPRNGFGLFDMIGNVWEWTRDAFSIPSDPSRTAPSEREVEFTSMATREIETGDAHPWRVIKGASYLCAANYCDHARPAARRAQDAGVAACHIGFRCVLRPSAAA
jgi:formylglycine-generating enzyme required for sulfatase activity